MERNIALAKRLEEVLLNGLWIANTNYKQQLESVTWEQATQKIGTLNTIAALTFHVNYYLAGVLNVLNGGNLEIKDQYSFNAPPVETEADWKKLIDELLQNAEAFVQKVENLPDSTLDMPFVDEKFGSYERNIEAIIEHNYYHLGQISLIKKMILQ